MSSNHRDPRWRHLARQAKERDNYQCRACGRFAERLEVDHVIPMHSGGEHHIDNLQTLCRDCHAGKTGRENPRKRQVLWQDDWEKLLKGRHSRARRGITNAA